MNVDGLFSIGVSSEVCLGFADWVVGDGRVAAFLSDGCSRAGYECSSRGSFGGVGRRVYTDFGARLLVSSGLSCFHRFPKVFPVSFDRVLDGAVFGAGALGLGLGSLSGTLLGLEGLEGGDVIGRLAGDGWFVGRRRDGSWEVIQVEFPGGVPYCLVDSLGDGWAKFEGEFGSSYVVRAWLDWVPGSPLGVGLVDCRELGVSGLDRSCNLRWDEFVFPFDEFDLLLGFGSGLGSVGRLGVSGGLVPVEVGEVLGVFVEALCGSFGYGFLRTAWSGPFGIASKFVGLGWEYSDDFSVVGLGW